MGNLNYIKVSVDEDNKIINIDPNVSKPKNTDSLDFFHDNVADIIDIINLGLFDYGEDIAFIIDDEGLLISENLVFLVEIGERSMHIAGNFLIGRNKIIDGEMYTIGFTKTELKDIKDVYGLKVSVIGLTK